MAVWGFLVLLSKTRDFTLWPKKDRLHDRLHAPQARKVRSQNSSVPSSNCSTVRVHVAGSSAPRGQELLSQVSHSASARAYASSSGVTLASSNSGGGEPEPTFRTRFGDEDRERRGAVTEGAKGGIPGVKRSDRHEQHTKAALQPAQGCVACAQTRACAMCQGSEGLGAGKTARLTRLELLSRD